MNRMLRLHIFSSQACTMQFKYVDTRNKKYFYASNELNSKLLKTLDDYLTRNRFVSYNTKLNCFYTKKREN